MTKINCIIIDDEPLAIQLLETYISKLPNWKIVQTFNNAVEAYDILQNQETNIDVILLDIKMPLLTGIEFVKSLSKIPYTVFTTAFNKYALEGYELNVVDYLLKPITFARFMKTASKISELLQCRAYNKDIADHIFVKHDTKLIRVDFKDIYFIEAKGDFIKIHLSNTSILIGDHTMKSLEDVLPENMFLRVHRSYIAGFSKIDGIKDNLLEIGQHRIPIGGNYKELLLKKITPKIL